MPFRKLSVVTDGAARSFLADGGEMGARIRAFDWRNHPLGSPDRWPVPLQTMVGILLTTQHPMFIFWGSDLRCFYNDAYARSIGPEKHPLMLGAEGPEMWIEIWDIIGPQLDHVMRGEGATWHENHLVPIIRNGRCEDVYWTYGCSPIPDSTAPCGVGGVLVVCNETTNQVLNGRRQAFLLQLDDALQPLEDARQIIATAAAILGRHLHVSRVGFGQVQPDDKTILVETNYTDGVVPISGTFTVDSFGQQNVSRQRQSITVCCNDVATEPAQRLTAYASMQIRAFISVPLVREGRFCASLLVSDRLPRIWGAHEVDLIETVAARLWDAVVRARAEAQLRLTTHRFELALRDSPIVAFSQDTDLRYTWIFNAACGYASGECIGRKDRDLFERAEDVAALDAIKRAVIDSAISRHEEVQIHAEGVDRYYDLLVDPIIGLDGEVAGITAVAVDITQRKSAEDRLRQTNEQLQVLAEHAPAAIALLDDHMCYIAVTKRWLTEFGFAGRNVVGCCHYDLFPELSQRWRDIHRRCLAGASEQGDSDPFVRADGSTRWLRWAIHPWRRPSGAVGGIAIFSEDITTRR